MALLKRDEQPYGASFCTFRKREFLCSMPLMCCELVLFSTLPKRRLSVRQHFAASTESLFPPPQHADGSITIWRYVRTASHRLFVWGSDEWFLNVRVIGWLSLNRAEDGEVHCAQARHSFRTDLTLPSEALHVLGQVLTNFPVVRPTDHISW